MKLNKKIFTALITLLSLIGIDLSALAQGTISPPSSFNKMSQVLGGVDYDKIPAPGMWNFGKDANNQVDYYTGTLSVSVPLYVYKDADFEIPVNLIYSSNGFKPNDQTGILGMGWSLSVGGSITREIRGLPDESRGRPKGFLDYFYYANDDISTSIINRTSYAINGITKLFLLNNGTIETESDIYHFNFMGHKGTFSLDGKETIYVYNCNHPSGEYSISFDRSLKQIIIKTGNGYEYTFGEVYESIYYPYAPLTSIGINHPKMWPLIKIKAANGRIARFKYRQQIQDIFHVNYKLWDYITYSSTGMSDNESGSGISEDQYAPGEHTVCLIDTVIVDAAKIVFKYGDKVGETRNGFSNPLKNTGQINGIDVLYNNNDIVKTINFTYGLTQGGNRKLILSQVRLSDVGSYKMNYYAETGTAFPQITTSSFDQWGYYNTTSSPSYQYTPEAVIPFNITDYTTTGAININNSKRPNANAAKIGMLQKITYPTGGYSEFEYGGHDYSHEMVRRYNDVAHVILPLTQNKSAGGLRIEKISSTTNGVSMFRRFKYLNPNNSALSSGIMAQAYTYVNPLKQYRERRLDYKNGEVLIIRNISSDSFYTYPMDMPYIEYSNVREEFSDNSAIEYEYATSLQIPDCVVASPELATNGQQIWEPTSTSAYVRFMQNANYYHIYRGKLTKKTSYNSLKNPVYKESYVYEQSTGKKAVESLGSVLGGFFYVYNTPVEDTKLLSKTITQYLNGNPVSSTTNYTYNALNQVIKESTTASDGKTQSVDYKFAGDYIGDIFTRMKSVNMVSNVIETITSNGGVEVNRAKTNYALTPQGLILPSSVQSSASGAGGLRTDMTYDKYDSSGNLLQCTTADGVPIAILWSYGNRYPIAMIKNTTYDNAIAKLTELKIYYSDLNKMLDPGQYTLINDMKKLRDKLPNTLMTIYTYKPLIGLTTSTDNAGDITYYDYDAYNRLKKISKSDGVESNHSIRTVQEFNYNYINN